MPKYILFDLDGTLTDPYEGITKSFKHALSRFGISEDDPEKLRWVIGPPLRETFLRYGIAPSRCEDAVSAYREHFGTLGLYQNTLYDGIPELLGHLKANGYTLAIASSKPEVYVKKIAEYFDIAKFFAFAGGAELNGGRSEKAEVIRYTISALGVRSGDRACMVGDREHDIIGAKKCCLSSIGVLYGYGSRAELEAAGAEVMAESVEELRGLL